MISNKINFKEKLKQKIVTVTLNPAIDKRWIVDRFKSNTVARVKQVIDTAGGKGLNETRVLHYLKVNVVATGILAGEYGNYFLNLLNKEKIKHDFYVLKHDNTRICVNISGQHDHSQSELLEPGPHLTKQDINGFINHFKKVIKGAKLVSIAGGIPKGVEPSIFKKLINICQQQKIKVFVDTSGESLKQALIAKPNFVKPNVDEIAQLLNKTNFNVNQALTFAKQHVKNGIENFVLSLGSRGAILLNNQNIYHAIPPKHKVVNTVGCGDTMVAGFIFTEILGLTPIQKIYFATAISTASSMTSGTAEVHLQDICKSWPKLKILK